MPKPVKITLIIFSLLSLGLIFYFVGFSSEPKITAKQQQLNEQESKQYIEMVKAKRRKLEEDVEESGVVKDYIATVELQTKPETKPWISIFVWKDEDVAVLYPKNRFDTNCVFKVFYDQDGFVWSSSGIYMSYEYQQKHPERKIDLGKFIEIETYTSEAFNLLKKKIITLNLRVKGLPPCIDEINEIKIETRPSNF